MAAWATRTAWTGSNPVTMPGEFTPARATTPTVQARCTSGRPRSLLGFCSVDLHDGFLPYRATATPARQWMGRIDDYLPDLQRGGRAAGGHQRPGHRLQQLGPPAPGTGPERLHPTNWTAQESGGFPPPPGPHPSLSSCGPALWRRTRPTCRLRPTLPCTSGRDLRAAGHRGLGPSRPDPGQNTADGFTAALSEAQDPPHAGRVLRFHHPSGPSDRPPAAGTEGRGRAPGYGDPPSPRTTARCWATTTCCASPRATRAAYMCRWCSTTPAGTWGLPQGRRCEALAELRDVMPTLLAAAGLPVPATVDGMDLAACARGAPGRGWLHGEHTAQQGPPHSMQYILMDGFKYLWYSHTGAGTAVRPAAGPRRMPGPGDAALDCLPVKSKR